MAHYTYKAANKEGGIVDGTMEARDEQVVVNRLQSLGLYPIKVETPSALDVQPGAELWAHHIAREAPRQAS